MADKKKEEHGGGGLSFGVSILIIVVVVFAIWVLAGGSKKETIQKSLTIPTTGSIETYGGYGGSE